MKDKIKIYQLSSSRNPENVRYIGKTSNSIKCRLQKHLSNLKGDTTYKGNWIRKEISDGFHIIIKSIYIVLENENWQDVEIKLISEYKKKGYKLTNLTPGGEGMHGKDNPFYNKSHTEESKQKLRISQPSRKEVIQYNKTGKIINKYDSIAQASKECKIPISSISNVCKIKKKYKTAGGYVWRFKGDSFSLEYENPAKNLRKKVDQYNKKGELIATYNSVSKACDITSIPSGNISRCCNKNLKTAGGYVWRFENDLFEKPSVRKGSKNIIQFDVDGNKIMEYNSISDAVKKTGINYSGIYHCANGKVKTIKGYIFKFK